VSPLTSDPGKDDSDSRARLEALGKPLIAAAQEFPEVMAELAKKELVHPDMRNENNLGTAVFHPAGIRLSLVFNATETDWTGLSRDQVHTAVQDLLLHPEKLAQVPSRLLRNPDFIDAVQNELATRLFIVEREVPFRVRVQQLVTQEEPKIVGNTELLHAYQSENPVAKSLLFHVVRELVVEGKVKVYDLLRLTQ
jgi:hypothetical protein